MRLAVRVGGRCTEILNETMRNLRCQRLQVDEIWTFVQKKQARLTFDERHAPGVGDQYVFVALDADSKLVPHFERNMVTAYKMMDTLRARLAAHFQLMTDGGVPLYWRRGSRVGCGRSRLRPAREAVRCVEPRLFAVRPAEDGGKRYRYQP